MIAPYLHATAERTREAVERAEQDGIGYTAAPGSEEGSLSAGLVPNFVPLPGPVGKTLTGR